MKKDLDRVLKHALTPTEEPDAWLDRNILYQAEEMADMAKKKMNRFPAAAAAAALTLVIGSAAVMAAARYLTPGQIAQELDDKKLVDAFQGEDAVLVNETQEYAGFRITLLGAVSGRNISEYLTEDDKGQVEDDRFYAAVAVERTDGSPMPDTGDDTYGEEPFYVSPYIKGLEPWKYSVASMGGGYSEFVRDGIQYRLLDMENIDIFADRGIYIGVSSGTFYDSEAYVFDEATGEITRNEDYDKVNALFDLPLAPEKGDPAAADAFLKSMEEEQNKDDEPREMEEQDLEVEAWINEFKTELQEGRIKEDAERIESTVQVCRVNEEDMAEYSYDLDDEGSGSGVLLVSELFPEKKPGSMAVSGYSCSESGVEDLRVETVVFNEDGTVTFAVYKVK